MLNIILNYSNVVIIHLNYCIMSDSKLSSAIFVATIKPFRGSNIRPSEEDKNHLTPILLDVVAGSCPNRRVLSGTVAKRAGMIEDNTYMCKYEEIDATEYGRQFRFSTIVQLTSPSEILEAVMSLGMPNLIEVVKNNPEMTKSGNYSYPKGLTVDERNTFDSLTAEQQDSYLVSHTSIRVHEL